MDVSRRESHFATHTHTLLAKRTWSRLTILMYPVAKRPPRPNFTCLQGNKVFLHSCTDRQLRRSCGVTRRVRHKTQLIVWTAWSGRSIWRRRFVEKKLWSLQQLEFNEKRVLGGCMTWITGLEKSAAIRPFATKKSRLASEKILLADSLATESCRLADMLATKLFFKADNADADRTWSRKFFGRRHRRFKMQGSWPFGPVDRVCE